MSQTCKGIGGNTPQIGSHIAQSKTKSTFLMQKSGDFFRWSRTGDNTLCSLYAPDSHNII